MRLLVFNEVFKVEFLYYEGIIDIKIHDVMYICICVFFENVGLGFLFKDVVM